MRAVIQRVSSAQVTVHGAVVGKIGHGFLVLLGVTAADGEAEAVLLARKIAGLRVFEDDGGKMNLALADVGGAVLAVSQFTFMPTCARARRPSFTAAAPARNRRSRCISASASCGGRRRSAVQQGVFQAHMQVALVNDGPVTIWMDTAELMYVDNAISHLSSNEEDCAMKYRPFGRTGMNVAEVSFGAWAIGGAWGEVDDSESLAALHKAVDMGCNFIDTADVYGDGRSERLIAQLKRERPNDTIYVATKAGRRLNPHTADGYNYDNLPAFVERSLQEPGDGRA